MKRSFPVALEDPKSWVLVTGASSGVGSAVVAQLLDLNYRVIAVASRPLSQWASLWGGDLASAPCFAESLAKTPELPPSQVVGRWLSDRCLALQVDLSEPTLRTAAFEQLRSELASRTSRLVAAVWNAGIGELGSIEDTPLANSRRLWEVNYWSIVEWTKALLPEWREHGGGRLVVLGSVVTELHFPFKAQYSASKAALTAWMESLDQEARPWGMEMSILEPGWIRSEFHERLPALGLEGFYGSRLSPFMDYSRDRDSKYPDGADVAKVVCQELTSSTMHLRRAVGPDARVFFRFAWWLRGAWRAALVRRLSR